MKIGKKTNQFVELRKNKTLDCFIDKENDKESQSLYSD